MLTMSFPRERDVVTRKAVLFLFQRFKDDLTTVTRKNIHFIQSQVPYFMIQTMKISELEKNYKFRKMKTELNGKSILLEGL